MNKEWKIYTRTGDDGTTALIGGKRVAKYDKRIEAYGTVDELNSWIGLIRDQEIDERSYKTLIEIQDRLFSIESLLAQGPGAETRKLPLISEKDILLLENEIDAMNEHLPPLTNFILPGGNTTVSYCHLARTVCRRAERIMIKVNRKFPIDLLSLKYVNRLSDYLFVLSRKISHDCGSIETRWIARI
ncbi:MAG TPA: cob(I)yrinic acid a,c-diamide adenosyltransferase [Bacteroidales bacterium]